MNTRDPNLTTVAEPQEEGETLPSIYGEVTSTTAMIFEGNSIDRMMKMADVMASSKVTVPQHFRGSPGDCLAVVMQAMQWKMNPFAVAQKTHIVNGTLGYEAQLVNAVVQQSGAIKGRFHYEYEGDGATLKCRVGALIRGETVITWSEWLKSSDVAVKNSPLWKTNPKQQLGYLQVKNWARAHTPGAILGVYTPDEMEDRAPERDITNESSVVSNTQPASAKDKLKSAAVKVTLGDVKNAIAKAATTEDMKAAGDLAGKLTSDEDKAVAKTFYAARLKELRNPGNSEKGGESPRPADTSAQGTPGGAGAAASNPAGDAPVVTFAQVEGQLRKAKDMELLSLAADLIGEVADQDERKELAVIYHELREKMGGDK